MKYPVEYTETTLADGSPALVVTVSGKAYENLKKIADAMNATSGLDTDNTPLSIVANFDLVSQLWDLGYGGRDAREVACYIAAGIDATDEAKKELARRFAAIDL